jgi:hypothetical protein
VLFEPIAAPYGRRSVLNTANRPFGEWGKILSDKAMTLAAIEHEHYSAAERQSLQNRKGVSIRSGEGEPHGPPIVVEPAVLDDQREADVLVAYLALHL